MPESDIRVNYIRVPLIFSVRYLPHILERLPIELLIKIIELSPEEMFRSGIRLTLEEDGAIGVGVELHIRRSDLGQG